MGKLKINLLNTSFTIQANEDSEYLDKLYGYYKRIIEDVKQIDSVKTPLQISILAGIMLCDELYKEKCKNHNNQDYDAINHFELSEAEKITLEMINNIDKVLTN